VLRTEYDWDLLASIENILMIDIVVDIFKECFDFIFIFYAWGESGDIELAMTINFGGQDIVLAD
jgi:hypothetical protein